MRRHRRSNWPTLVAASVFLLAASACGVGGGTVAPGPDGRSELNELTDKAAEPTTVPATAPSAPSGYTAAANQTLVELIDSVDMAEGGTLIRGTITAAPASGTTVVVSDVVETTELSPSIVAGTTATLTPISSEARATRVTDAVAARQDGLPALMLIDGDSQLKWVIPLDETLLRFSRDTTAEPSQLFSAALSLGRWIDDGSLAYETHPPLDPLRSVWCQDTSMTTVQFSAEEHGDEVASLIAFARAIVASEVAAHQRREILDTADTMALEASFIDPVTGDGTRGWTTDVTDQLLRGVPVGEVVVHPTVQLLLQPGTLKWMVEERPVVVFGEAGTGRLLGWTDYAGYRPGDPVPPDRLQLMVPPSGGDVAIYLRELDSQMSCLENPGEPFMTIPFDDIAGQRRAEIILDDASYVDWPGGPG